MQGYRKPSRYVCEVKGRHGHALRKHDEAHNMLTYQNICKWHKVIAMMTGKQQGTFASSWTRASASAAVSAGEAGRGASVLVAAVLDRIDGKEVTGLALANETASCGAQIHGHEICWTVEKSDRTWDMRCTIVSDLKKQHTSQSTTHSSPKIMEETPGTCQCTSAARYTADELMFD